MTPHLLDPDLLQGDALRLDVAGAGGNGSQIITGLARMHFALVAVGHPGLEVTLWDPDTITDANVGRQLFSPSDVGLNKAQVLIHRINCYYGLHWSAEPRLFNSNDANEANFLIGCVDSIAARKQLGKAWPNYWLDLGNRDRTGQVILGKPERKPASGHKSDTDPTRPRTVLEIFPELLRAKKEDNAPSCSLAAALERQDLFINQAVATWALHLLWSFIRNGHITVQGYFINLETGKVVPIPIPQPDPNAKTKGKPLAEIFA